MQTEIGAKIQGLQDSIRQASQRAGRGMEEIRLILVTKTVTPDRVQEAYTAGMRDFGENRMQEFLDKVEALPEDVKWHFIGHLQTNKVKYLFGRPYEKCGVLPLIHSMDRPELAEALDHQAKKTGVGPVPCLLQVNSSGETTKGGFEPAAVLRFVSSLAQDSLLKLKGLMTIGPLTEDEKQVRASFRTVRLLQLQLQKECPRFDWGILSMGMSGDYRIAIEEGANLLRVGSLVFGERN